jgi:hypothetical protein
VIEEICLEACITRGSESSRGVALAGRLVLVNIGNHLHSSSPIFSVDRIRRRKVKCDEEKPCCKRCLSASRTCEGYGVWGGGKTGVTTGDPFNISLQSPNCISNHMMPFPIQGATADEMNYFDFFRRRTVTRLPGFFDSNLWDNIIFQASLNERAVLHAVVALASAHRSEEITHCTDRDFVLLKSSSPMNKHERFALQQYNKSINSLQEKFLSNNHRFLHAALITCMMFVCLDLLRGEYWLGYTHLLHGLNLLSQRSRPDEMSHNRNVITRPTEQYVDDCLIEAFVRINLQSAMFGLGTQHAYFAAQELKYHANLQIPHTFESIFVARQCLESIINTTFQLAEKRCSNISDATALAPHQRHVQESLACWLSTYEESLSSLRASGSPRTILGLELLRTYHTMTGIILVTCLAYPDESIFDSQLTAFRSIVNEVAQLIEVIEAFQKSPAVKKNCYLGNVEFTVDMGLIPLLHYTAMKCREPVTRRQAIELLRLTPQREGMWDGVVVARMATKVMEMEEEDFYRGFDFNVTAGSTGVRGSEPKERLQTLPLPVSRMFNQVKVKLVENMRGKAMLHCRRCIHEGGREYDVREVIIDIGHAGAEDILGYS